LSSAEFFNTSSKLFFGLVEFPSLPNRTGEQTKDDCGTPDRQFQLKGALRVESFLFDPAGLLVLELLLQQSLLLETASLLGLGSLTFSSIAPAGLESPAGKIESPNRESPRQSQGDDFGIIRRSVALAAAAVNTGET
jgi:hypothetical protein